MKLDSLYPLCTAIRRLLGKSEHLSGTDRRQFEKVNFHKRITGRAKSFGL